MKDSIKKVVLFSLIVVAVLMLSLNVNAATIKETTNTNDEYDTIEEGTIVIGVSKFTPGTVVTGVKASTAGANDMKIYVATHDGSDKNYTYPKMYYYLLGDWYEYDEEGNLNAVSGITSLDIYYVNNEPKTGITIPEIPEEEPEVKEYEVFFMNGTEYEVRTVEEGKTIAELPTFTKENCEFVGFKDKEGKEFTTDTVVNGNIAVFAEWKQVIAIVNNETELDAAIANQDIKTIKIASDFEVSNSKVINRNMTIETTDGTVKTITKSGTPSFVSGGDNYIFKLGYGAEGTKITVKNLKLTNSMAAILVGSNVEVTVENIDVTGNVWGGIEASKNGILNVNSITMTDEAYKKPVVWVDTADLESAVVNYEGATKDEFDKEGNIQYHYYTSLYTVTYNADNGTENTVEKLLSGQKATKPETDPTKTGYIFKGWYLGDTEYNFDTEVTSNIELKAKWKSETAVVNSEEEFNNAVADTEIKIIELGGTFEVNASLIATRSLTIDGKGYAITKSGTPEYVPNGDNYILKLGYAESEITVKDLSLSNAMAAIIVGDKSEVTVKNVNVSGNVWGGIEVAADGTLNVTSITMTDEEYYKPVVWVDVDSIDTATVNYEGSYMTDKIKGQHQYYTSKAIANGSEVTTIEGLTNALANSEEETITLETTVFVPEDEEVKLDLNGKTLNIKENQELNVNGKLTINDTSDDGAINLSGETSKIYVAEEAELILEDGKINASNYYGIYSDNGKIVMNGGSIEAYYSCVTSNGTTGKLEFEMNGGTLTSTYGPAMYIPSPATITINNGTINGGIGARMGDITINGGTINSITSSIDSPSEYYNYQGNAWLPDAIFIFAGTYGYDKDVLDNHLNLNITGGTINCLNDQGSAVAIYNLGKVEQEKSVTIKEEANLSTTATTRNAFDVLEWDDFIAEGSKDSNGNDNSEFKDEYTKYVTEIDLTNVAEKYKTNG